MKKNKIFAHSFINMLTRPSLHISWFILVLGGISLFEKGWWSAIGAILLLAGIYILSQVLYYYYYKKKAIQNAQRLLLTGTAGLGLLIITELLLKRMELSVLLLVLSVPVVIAWITLRGAKKTVAKKK